jgi:F-type H+-transporting ATPase subunit delta
MATVSIKSFAQAIYEAAGKKEGKDLDAVLAHAVEILSEKHFLGKKDEVLEKLQEIIDQKEGVIRARIESATPLFKTTLASIEKELKKRYGAEEVRLEESINPSYLGGIKIRVGDEVIDLTLAHKINQLQNYLITH